MHEVHVVHVDDFVVGLSLGIGHEDYLVTSIELTLDLSIPFEYCGTHLGTLGVEEYSDVGGDGTSVLDHLSDTFLGHVSRVHTHDIDTSLYEGTDKVHITA